jgi:quercetin dioxygenase-like cupin family protein
MLGQLIMLKASGKDTDGAMGLVEQVGPPGTGSPPHIHHNEDEWFYVIEGEATFVLGGDTTFEARAGSFVFGPRGVMHQFTNAGEEPCRMLLGFTPAGFENFIMELGDPAPHLTLPPPSAPDMEKLFTLAKKYHVELLLPAPTSS